MYKKYSQKHQDLKNIFRLFCENTSINGFNRITNNKIPLFEKRFWILLNLISIIGSGFMVKHLWTDYLDNPILITENTHQIPVQKVSFPAVAVCSVNKISKKRAENFADLLYRKAHRDRRLRSKSEILESIKMLGDLYDFNLREEETNSAFQIYLEDYDNVTSRDISKRLIKLAPNCDEILLKCVWGGIEYNCHDLLKQRITFDGLCCIFNYIRPYINHWLRNINNHAEQLNVRHARGAGVNNGLQLILKDNTNDYFLTTMETKGYVIYIFNPKDFPDKSSGDLTEVIVNFGEETFISLDASVISPSDDIKILSENMRNCIYSDEKKTIFGKYRHSDCLAACKVLAIESLCQCIPFTQPLEVSNYCTLSELHCMNRFKTKWVNYFPDGEDNLDSLNSERQMSLSCPECLPACSHEVYKVSVDVTDSFNP